MAFGNLAWNGLMAPTRLNLLPNPTPTNKFIPALGPLIDKNLENILQMVEEKEEFSNPAAQCARYSNNWNVKYDEATGECFFSDIRRQH